MDHRRKCNNKLRFLLRWHLTCISQGITFKLRQSWSAWTIPYMPHLIQLIWFEFSSITKNICKPKCQRLPIVHYVPCYLPPQCHLSIHQSIHHWINPSSYSSHFHYVIWLISLFGRHYVATSLPNSLYIMCTNINVIYLYNDTLISTWQICGPGCQNMCMLDVM